MTILPIEHGDSPYNRIVYLKGYIFQWFATNRFKTVCIVLPNSHGETHQVNDVRNVVVWGCHAKFPDVDHAVIKGKPFSEIPGGFSTWFYVGFFSMFLS